MFSLSCGHQRSARAPLQTSHPRQTRWPSPLRLLEASGTAPGHSRVPYATMTLKTRSLTHAPRSRKRPLPPLLLSGPHKSPMKPFRFRKPLRHRPLTLQAPPPHSLLLPQLPLPPLPTPTTNGLTTLRLPVAKPSIARSLKSADRPPQHCTTLTNMDCSTETSSRAI